MKFLVRLIGSGLGSGYVPVAPGTVGSSIALLIWVILPEMKAAEQIALVAITFFIGIPVCRAMEADYGHDPRQATFDEVVGQWAALLLLPKTTAVLVASFLIFRAFDILKPFPARRSQKLPGGWGIMVDDLIVGIYTCLLIHLYRLVF